MSLTVSLLLGRNFLTIASSASYKGMARFGHEAKSNFLLRMRSS